MGPGGCNGGYLTLSFTRRHVSGPQMEAVVWSCVTLHQFVAYHVKATKVGRLGGELIRVAWRRPVCVGAMCVNANGDFGNK